MSALAITAEVLQLLELLAQAEQARQAAKAQADRDAALAHEEQLWEQIKAKRAAVQAVITAQGGGG